VDPYMVQQALGQGNAQEASEYRAFPAQIDQDYADFPGPISQLAGLGQQVGGFAPSNPDLTNWRTFTSPAMANQYDLNFDNAVGADDLAMALKAQAAGRAYDPMAQAGDYVDYRDEWEREQGIREQYGDSPRPQSDPRAPNQLPYPPPPRPSPGEPGYTGGVAPERGIDTLRRNTLRRGRNQTRGLRRPGGRGRRQFGLGGIVDAYGRRLI
jgi:hypothetical protein